MMSDSNATVPTAAFAVPEGWVEVGVYATASEGAERGLVVLAIGEAYWLVDDAGGYRLLVESHAAARVRVELDCFERESARSSQTVAPPLRQFEFTTPLCWVLAIAGCFWLETIHPRWVALGALDPVALFRRGEAWRPLTALFLHADVAHLVANAVSGIFVFAAVLAEFGRGRGWLLILASSLLGNLAVAAAHVSGDYRSIGASTAVFAALGLLTARAVLIASTDSRRGRGRAFFVPAATGAVVLGLFGAGGQHVDVLAHVTGFLSGSLLGLAAGRQTVRDAK